MITIDNKKFGGEVEFARYLNGDVALRIVDYGEPVATASVNLEGRPGAGRPSAEQVWLKTWSENTGLAEALVAAGVVELLPVEYAVNSFGSIARLAKLTPLALAELAKQEGRAAPPPSKVELLDRDLPGWRDLKYANGQPQFSADGTMLDEDGDRSIFDDVDEGGE